MATMNPPSFYEKDIERYKLKFQASIDGRLQYKKKMERVFRSTVGEKINQKVKKGADSAVVRPPSR